MNLLIGIQKDADIIKFRAELYDSNAPRNRQMEAYEKDPTRPGPILQPMWPNFKKILGEWNRALFELFLAYCASQEYGDGMMTEEDEAELQDIFILRFRSICQTVNDNRPKGTETVDDARGRAYADSLLKLERQRANTRRGQVNPKHISYSLLT